MARAIQFSKVVIKAARAISGAAADVLLTAQASAGQTANLLELKNSAGVVTAAAGPDGVLSPRDSAGLVRAIFNGTAKTIVDGSATSLFDITCPAGAMIGGVFVFTIEASDGTDHQALSGIVSYAAVNKVGTHTCTITQLSTTEAKAVSTGTLTLTWTHVTGANKTTVKLQPTGSLTETTYRITYTVFPAVGAVTIL